MKKYYLKRVNDKRLKDKYLIYGRVNGVDLGGFNYLDVKEAVEWLKEQGWCIECDEMVRNCCYPIEHKASIGKWVVRFKEVNEAFFDVVSEQAQSPQEQALDVEKGGAEK